MTSKKMEDDLKKIRNEDNQKKKWKTNQTKMEDKPINQNQPNWL